MRYTPEFVPQMVNLGRCGRTPASLAKEFGPTLWSILLWVKEDGRDAGLTSTEREELARLCRENRQLKEEPEILSKGAAWFAIEGAPSKRSSGVTFRRKGAGSYRLNGASVGC